jgi:chemotaxis protein MotB
MAGKTESDPNRRPIVIVKRDAHAQAAEGHGGAWKVAYADFVTAMMAFFLLMWLLNATTPDQRRGLADYFSPNNALVHSRSGNGQILSGHTPNDAGDMVSDRGMVRVITGKAPAQPEHDDDPTVDTAGQTSPADAPQDQASLGHPAEDKDLDPPDQDAAPPAGGNGTAPRTPVTPTRERTTSQPAKDNDSVNETQRFSRAASEIREAIRKDPGLAEFLPQLAVEVTPEGLRLQIVDQDKRPMFATGSAVPNDWAKRVLQKVVPVLNKLPEKLSLAGHTDAAPYPGPERTNWELSADRANATRRLLLDFGLDAGRIRSVTGNADRDLLLPATPLAAANRRIAILVLRDAKPSAQAAAPSVPAAK